MQPSILNTSTVRRSLMPMPDKQLMRNNNNSMHSRETSKIRWLIGSCSEKKPWQSIWKKEQMWMQLLIRWLRKITRWFESTKWSKSKVNKIWSSRLTRRKLFFRGRKSLKNMRKSWWDNLPLNNRKEQIIYNKWKCKLNSRERPYSINLHRKRKREESNKSILRI